MSRVTFAVLLAIGGDQGTLVEGDAFCAKGSVKVLDLSALMAFECADKRLP